jgi:hypothetical protein
MLKWRSLTAAPPPRPQVVVVVNARPSPYVAAFPPDAGQLQLHPELAALVSDAGVQACRVDNERQQLEVAARTAAVFVERRR